MGTRPMGSSGTPIPAAIRARARADTHGLYFGSPPSSAPGTGGHSQPGSGRPWAGPPLILVQLWVHLLLLPKNPHPS